MIKEKIIMLGQLQPQFEKKLAEEFDVVFLRDQSEPKDYLREHGALFTGLVTNAGIGVNADIVDQLPNLKVVSSLGVGFDQLDPTALQPRHIHVGYTPDVLNDCVADTAMGLLLDCSRQFSAADRFVRSGKWPQGPYPLQRQLTGKRLGIFGLGRIGMAIAERASAFKMPIAYHNRKPRPDCDLTYMDNLEALAQWCDYLIIAVTGGAQTEGLVDAKILDALGEKGYLINISRGAVVDEIALLEALQDQRIAGAGLDVYVNEPHVPEGFMGLDNVVLLPHVGSATYETRQAMADLVLQNLHHFYQNGQVKTPVPWADY